jgi:hypothetical protein
MSWVVLCITFAAALVFLLLLYLFLCREDGPLEDVEFSPLVTFLNFGLLVTILVVYLMDRT